MFERGTGRGPPRMEEGFGETYAPAVTLAYEMDADSFSEGGSGSEPTDHGSSSSASGNSTSA